MIKDDIFPCLRFDSPGVAISRSPYKTPEGYLYADSVFARDGVLTYHKPDGTTHRELRLPEENKKKHTLFAAVPLTMEHPPKLLTPDTAKAYAKGFTLSETAYDTKGGFVRGGIMAFDSALIAGIERGDSAETSAGYTCVPAYISSSRSEPGIWRGERYDSIQEINSVNHVCTTRLGRAGSQVRVLMDSLATRFDTAYEIELASSDPHYQPTTQYFDLKPIMNAPNSPVPLKIGRGEIRVDSATAAMISPELDRLDSLSAEKVRWDSERSDLQEKIDSLQEQLDSLTEEKERLEGRCDTYEDIAEQSLEVLDEFGYYYDSATNEIKEDMDKKLDEDEEDEDDDEDILMDMLDDDDEEEEEEEKKDSSGEILVAFDRARQILPTLKAEPHLDSVAAVRREVLQQLNPRLDLSEKSQGWIDGRYELMEEMRRDSGSYQRDSTEELKIVIDSAERNAPYDREPDENLAKMRAKMDSNVQQPLAMSKDS